VLIDGMQMSVIRLGHSFLSVRETPPVPLLGPPIWDGMIFFVPQKRLPPSFFVR